MGRLSNQDIMWIILYWVKGKSVVGIAHDFRVLLVNECINSLRSMKGQKNIPPIRKTGRKPQPIDEETEELVLECYRANTVGASYLEKKIEETHGIYIPHNRIFRVLLNHDPVEINMRKRQQRKYVRYEQTHSMSMWQGDWKESELDGSKRWLVAFMDDSSRLITCNGVFDAPTTENTITTLNQGFQEYGTPREILTDPGTLFVSSRNRGHAHHTCGEFLKHHNINHILAGVKHPPTNGKTEQFFGEVERRIKSSVPSTPLFTDTMSSSFI